MRSRLQPDAKRVLILSASYGGGHNQVAQAVREALKAQQPSCEVHIADFVEFVSAAVNRVTQLAYLESIKHLPAAYGAFYRLTGNIRPDSWFQRRLNALGKTRLHREVADFRPDAILCTFPTQAGVLSELRTAGRVGVPVFTVITDHTVHSQWVHPGVDQYFVSADEVARELAARGIPRGRIEVTGIPLRSGFAAGTGREGVRQQLGLRPDRPAVLVMAGAFAALGGIERVVKRLATFGSAHQLIVVAGRDAALAARLRGLLADAKGARVFGFVDDVPAFMRAADVLVTKAGGITTSEALACGLPMVIYGAIPGQEEANARFLSRHGAAVVARDAQGLATEIEALLRDGERRARIGAAAASLGRPQAAAVVARRLLVARPAPSC